MFTGLIEEVGRIKSMKRIGQSIRLDVSCFSILSDINIGDSISTEGVCLTVTAFGSDYFSADLMPETVNMSSYKNKRVGSVVNLERAMQLNGRFGGHMVSGHIDGVGKIKYITKDEIAYRVFITCQRDLLKYIIKKGSIAIDGISLTVSKLDHTGFEVSVIPQTVDDTTLLKKTVGEIVNLENDMIAKYTERLVTFETSGVSEEFLKEHGFL